MLIGTAAMDDRTPKDKAAKLAARRAAYAAMSPDKKAARRARENANAKKKRDSETPVEREHRLALMRERAKNRVLAETPAQRESRLAYLREYGPKHKAANKDRIRQWSKEFYRKNKDHVLAVCKSYRKRNADAIAKKAKEKLKSDPVAAITARLRHRIYLALRPCGAKKHASTLKLVGCSRKFLVAWIESQFPTGMGWHNRQSWHVDHIVPCSAFDMTNAGQQRVAFHYLNLRPMWATENISKGSSLAVSPRKQWTLACIAEAREAVGIPACVHVARELSRARG